MTKFQQQQSVNNLQSKQMKSVFRLYAKTSKGNDAHLLRQLKSFKLSPKYDPHLNAFYFNANFNTLFDLSFHSLTIQNMYLQIGQKFSLIDESQITQQLQKLQFKNYLPIGRNLVENTTFKILIRECSMISSENVLTNLITTVLSREVIKKEYYKNILGQSKQAQFNLQQKQKGLISWKQKQRVNNESFYQIRDSVQRKWHQQDVKLEQEMKKKLAQLKRQMLELQQICKINDQNQNQHQEKSGNSNSVTVHSLQNQLASLKKQIKNIQVFDKDQHFQKMLCYCPHLIFYGRKNKGRMLLKVNAQEMYKHGWKTAVNWGPIRQSIAASVIYQSKIIDQFKKQSVSQNQLKIWDPFCGSGTFPLVATTMLNNIPIHADIHKTFIWQHWPVFKQHYLDDYYQQKKKQLEKMKNSNFKMILSDISLQSINYSIQNFKELLNSFKIQSNAAQTKIFPSSKPIDQIYQLVPNKIGFFCGDFQKVMQSLIPLQKDQSAHLNIISNLPYLHGRSKQKHPLNQLQSIYKRFNKMVGQYAKHFDNIFIIVDRNTKDWNHFINQSTERWNLISEYRSGGFQIGLYAWQDNKISATYDQTETQIATLDNTAMTLTSKEKELVVNKQKSIGSALAQYREKLSAIQKKYYNLPAHLIKTKTGWRRIKEKRRKRHLQTAYKLFCQRRDKLIALKQYSSQKLQVKMLRRGTIWKQKNMELLNNGNQLDNYSFEIKTQFQAKIGQALKRQQQREQRRKLKDAQRMQVIKQRSKWNSDLGRLTQQVQKSSSRQFKKHNRQLKDGTLKFQQFLKNKKNKYPVKNKRR